MEFKYIQKLMQEILRDHIRHMQNEIKVLELSAKGMVKVLHKVFKSVLNELNNLSPTLE